MVSCDWLLSVFCYLFCFVGIGWLFVWLGCCICYCVFGSGWFGYIVGGCECLCLLGCMDGLSFRVF